MKVPKFTPKKAEKIAKQYVEKFVICKMLISGGVSYYESRLGLKPVIFLSKWKTGPPNNTVLTTFLHELLHVFHRTLGLSQNESVIERKALRFFKRWPDFTKKLFNEVFMVDARIDGIKIVSERIKKEIEEKYGRS